MRLDVGAKKSPVYLILVGISQLVGPHVRSTKLLSRLAALEKGMLIFKDGASMDRIFLSF